MRWRLTKRKGSKVAWIVMMKRRKNCRLSFTTCSTGFWTTTTSKALRYWTVISSSFHSTCSLHHIIPKCSCVPNQFCTIFVRLSPLEHLYFFSTLVIKFKAIWLRLDSRSWLWPPSSSPSHSRLIDLKDTTFYSHCSTRATEATGDAILWALTYSIKNTKLYRLAWRISWKSTEILQMCFFHATTAGFAGPHSSLQFPSPVSATFLSPAYHKLSIYTNIV